MSDSTPGLLAFVGFMLLGRFVAQRKRRAPGSSIARGRVAVGDWTAVVVAVATGVAVALPVVEGVVRSGPITTILSAALGALVILGGWGVAYLANDEIGRNWSPAIDKSDDQLLITSGVYSLVRHPLYLAGLIVIAGGDIYFRATWGWAGLMLATGAVVFRIPREERRLLERFGEEYATYRGRTKALVPWIA